MNSSQNDGSADYDTKEGFEDEENLWTDEMDEYYRQHWKVGTIVGVYSNSLRNWYEGTIVDIFTDEEGEWLEIEVDEDMIKQLQRFSSDLRVTDEAKKTIIEMGMRALGANNEEMEEEKDSFEVYSEQPNSSLGVISEDFHAPSKVADIELLEGQEIVVFVDRAGETAVNGKYKEDGMFNQARRFRLPSTDFVISMKYQERWVLHDYDKDYYQIAASDIVPPNFGWQAVEGGWPAPGLRHHFIQKLEEEFMVKLCEDDEEQFQFEEWELEVRARPLGMVFTTTGDASATFEVDYVDPEGEGARAGFQRGDVMILVDGEEVYDDDDLKDVLSRPNLPFFITIRRQRTEIPILECSRGAVELVNGKYTISGEYQGSWRFVKNDDSLSSIVKIHEEDGQIVWCIQRNSEPFYVGLENEEVEGLPPSWGWDVANEKGKYPVPGIKIHWVTIEPPPQPVIKRVVTGDGCATIDFECIGSLVPITSTKMLRWFQVESFPITHIVQGDSDKRSITISNLVNGQDYVFFVKACNQILNTRSIHSDLMTPLAVPPVPKIKKVTSGEGWVKVEVDSSSLSEANDESVQATIFLHLQSEGKDTVTQIIKDSSPILFDELDNGVEYNVFTVSSNTTASSKSEPIKAKPAIAPQTPLIVNARHGCRRLIVEYECEGYDDFKVQASFEIETIPPTQVFKTNELKAVIPRCINGQTYRIIVRSVNATASMTSKPSKKLTPLGPPPTPKLTLTTPQDRAALIEWSCEDLATPEEAITHFEYNDSLSKEARYDWLNIGLKCPARIQKLQNGKEYKFYIRAVNKRGYSKPSSGMKCTPISPPPKPIKVEAIAGNATANIFWVCADVMQQKFNGCFIVESDQCSRKYECKRLRCRIKRLQNGIPYRFTVTAKNLAGEARSDPSPPIICKGDTRPSIFVRRTKALRFQKDDQNIAYQKRLQAIEVQRRRKEKNSHFAVRRGLRRKFSMDAAAAAKEKDNALNERVRRAQNQKEQRMKHFAEERKRKADERLRRVLARKAELEKESHKSSVKQKRRGHQSQVILLKDEPKENYRHNKQFSTPVTSKRERGKNVELFGGFSSENWKESERNGVCTPTTMENNAALGSKTQRRSRIARRLQNRSAQSTK